MNNTIINIHNAIPKITFPAFTQPINWQLKNKEHWAVIGANGAGKSLFIDILLKKHPLKSGEIICKDEEGEYQNIWKFIKSVSFKDIYSLTHNESSYYQQRWNTGLEEEIPVVKELLSKDPEEEKFTQELISLFHIEDLINKKIHLLSSGELRKILIIKSLSSNPRVLILDNPFIGLDAKSRLLLKEVLQKITTIKKLQLILLVADTADIPPFITHILPIKNKELLPPVNYNQFLSDINLQEELFSFKRTLPTSFPTYKKDTISFENVIIFNQVNIKYSTRTILKNLSWKVKKGEKWALLGENGSGKSTLLSLVAADNPQAYANDIILFDKRRGTGESIWDIKKHIGYISPEMHLYYQKKATCLEVVSSGFFDTIGLYKKCNPEQLAIATQWMELLNIEHLKSVSFLHISTGEQRLVLIARVFVKNPDLIILDEPMHGLDTAYKKYIKQLIEQYCTFEKALIYVTHHKEEIPKIINHQLILTKN